MADPNTKIILGLAAGKVYQKKSEPPMTQSKLLREFMNGKGWVFWSPEDIKEKIEALAKPESGYHDDPSVITAKILMR